MHQVCADAKNLVAVETRQKQAAGATTRPLNADMKGKIVEFLWYLKKQGYSEYTIRTYVQVLEMFVEHGADLLEPESVKRAIVDLTAQRKWGEGRRNNAVKAYTAFLKMIGMTWRKPRVKFKRGLPRPPTREQVKMLIAGASRKYAVIFKFLAETGASPIEASILKERNFDFDRNIVYIEGRKGHLDRIVPMTAELSALMKEYLAKYGKFPRSDMIGRKWRKYRNRLAKKLNDSSLKKIRLYDLRHYFGTMLYAQTRDILYVKDKMGHSKLETTMIYTKLVALPTDEEFICRAAESIEEAEALIEAGFEYVTDFNNVKLFRKHKILVDLSGGPWSSGKGPGSSEKGPWSSMV